MKPKTKLQMRVAALSKKLPRIKQEHKIWVREKLLKHYVYRTRERYTCMKCGKGWAVSKMPRLEYLLDEVCPHCGATLHSMEGKKRSINDRQYFFIASIVDGMQVLRYFCVERKCKVNEKMRIYVGEVCQHWITAAGNVTVMAIKRNFLGCFSQTPWCFGSEMEVRKDNDRYYEYGEEYPNPRYLKELRRNGFRRAFHRIHPAYLFSWILRDPHAETLLKAGQFALLNHFCNMPEMLTGIWPSIRICMRNNYIVKSAEIWVDHLRMLEDASKDLLNAKYVCPPDLKAVHQKMIDVANRLERKREAEERRRQIEKENKLFKKRKARYFGLTLTDGVISVVVLEDINDYYEEGADLNHCVFQRRYYEKSDTLILSARKLNGERLATVELSLKEWKVLQCRGNHNSQPKQYNEIVNLVHSNIDQFKKRVRMHREAHTHAVA